MSSTIDDAVELIHYYFWAWQYTVRNFDFINNRKILIDTVCELEESGIMSQHVALDTVADRFAWEERKTIIFLSPVQNGWAPRCPTDKEQFKARTALELQGYFSRLGYSYSDLCADITPASEIVANIDTYAMLSTCPRKKCYTSPYPFQTCRLLIDREAKPMGLFRTRVGSESAGMRPVLIDFTLPLDRILCEIRAIYEQVNGADGYATNSAIREIVQRQGGLIGFDARSRVLGLWLWDFVEAAGGEKKRGVVAAGIRAMRAQLGQEIKALGFADSEERVFRSFYRRTAVCIEACEALSFK